MMRKAMLYEELDNNKVHCFLCSHHCKISHTKFGFCGVRQNRDGVLYTHAYGEVISANVDPVEKKPLFHFLPGTLSFSIATAGCNFRCGFCQNWQISQISKRDAPDLAGYELSPEDIVSRAIEAGCRSISYTYTEPTIFFEYAYYTAKLAKERGLFNVFVTNGYMTSEALDAIRHYLDACNVDLKSFRNDFYKKICQARLEPVLKSIRHMRKLDIWVEVTTLVIPNQNDDEKELADIARFIAEVDTDIPWHISRFHPGYQFTDSHPTPLDTLKKAYSLGRKEGLKFVYVGNVAGESEDTICPSCGQTLIRRKGFLVEGKKMRDSRCPSCGETIPGVFVS